MIMIITGVSGSGKTSVGRKLSNQIGFPFYDADDFHNSHNIEKMKNNTPLTDEDRQSWLKSLKDKIIEWDNSGGAILACSALKESYRQSLSCNTNIFWVFLSGEYEIIRNRMFNRVGHYMPIDLLKSQFEILEVPEYGLHIDINNQLDDIVNLIILKLNQ